MAAPRAPAAFTLQWILLVGNLLGATVAFVYFRVVDHAQVLPPVRWFDVVVSIIIFGLLVGAGVVLSVPWTRPLGRLAKLPSLPPAEAELVRRRALLFPYFLAGLSAVGWTMAGLIWGTVWPLLAGVFSPYSSLRALFGNTVIAGGVTTAFVFFASEHHWRRRLPEFFPEGDLSAVRGVPRLAVRVRLLAIFLLIGVVPLAVLGMLAYTRAVALVGADPAAAALVVAGLRVTILYLVGAGVVAAVGLSIFVAHSVAAPLRDVEAAMAEVERGRLDGRAPVVSTDEIGAVAEGFNRMLHGLRERERVKETFGKYVTPEIRDAILAGRVRGEGELIEATVLFADLRDFTPWVEATEPREVVRDLNEYFTEMDRAIRAHGGLVLQFIGDEIEAVFGAPIAARDHAGRAVHAAIEMRRRLQAWNARREAAGRPPMRHGIGIHTGTVLAGNIGGAERLSYALVGDPVNLASRIQGLTKDFKVDILISEATRGRLDGAVSVEELPAVRVKGRVEDVNVYKVM
ncbi:MAG TPA: adenylate/guanylate cyclase domain-containing protein [Candidatus Limnocylindria bacterium]|nr:adenylate/guanylate cyclase domain-containing protein [Candidatus Limnocylindria bacterium]